MDWEAVVGIISVCVTAMGWGVVYYLARIREDRSRQIEHQLERCDRQIEEFYGPLYNLMQQIENTFYVNDEILKMSGLSPEERAKEEEYIREHFFFPLHDEAVKVLRTRMHLVPEVPSSLWKYLKHVTQERIKHELVVRADVPARINYWEPYSQDLPGDLKEELDRARKQQEELLQARMQLVGGGLIVQQRMKIRREP